jgi:hypothetical protein
MEVVYQKRFVKLLRLTAALVVANAALLVVQYWPHEEPEPYRDVALTSAVLTADNKNLLLHAVFVKTDCVFVRLSVVGVGLNGAHLLEWESIDGLGQDYDRIAGLHSLRLKIALGEFEHDRLEIRTRHDCDGEMVDKLFLEYSMRGVK